LLYGEYVVQIVYDYCILLGAVLSIFNFIAFLIPVQKFRPAV